MSKRSRRVTRQQSPEIPETPTFNVQTLAAAINEVKNDLKSSQDALIERMKNEILAEVSNRLESIPANGSNRRLNTTVDVEQPMSQTPRNSPKAMTSTKRPNDNNDRLLLVAKGTLIDRFTGSDSKINAKSWIKLYEHIAKDLEDDSKVQVLTSYLSNDALMWFSDEIVGNGMNWHEVRTEFLSRYGTATVPPAVEAEQRRLLPNESVQVYAQEKMRLLKTAGIPIGSALDLLTAGTPPSYHLTLFAATPKTFNEWLSIALKIENSKRETRIRNQDNVVVVKDRQTYANAVRNGNKRPMSRNDAPPPYACRHCRRNGVTGEAAMHW